MSRYNATTILIRQLGRKSWSWRVFDFFQVQIAASKVPCKTREEAYRQAAEKKMEYLRDLPEAMAQNKSKRLKQCRSL